MLDRIFDQTEREIRNIETTLKPKECLELFKTVAQMRRPSDDLSGFYFYGYKTAIQEVGKPPLKCHIQFSKYKRLILSRAKKTENIQ